MMTAEKDKWVNQVLDTAEGIQRANAPGSFHAAVMRRAKETGRQIEMISASVILRMAAVILVLIVLNFGTYAIIGDDAQSRSTHKSDNPIEALVSDYSISSETTAY